MKYTPLELELLGIILDCWYQFAYEGDNGKSRWAGGLSTLESIEGELKRRGIINRNGNISKEGKKLLSY